MKTSRLSWLPLLLFLFLAATLGAQAPRDSAPAPTFSTDRYVIDAAQLVRDGGARSIADLLVSQVPGLLVVPGSGLNGAGSRIRFAGVRSLINDSPPLILVDGVRVDAAEDASLVGLGGAGPLRLEDLSPEDIESIEVLRSPADGAIYGPGATNGVILIHTQGGRLGPMRWETHAQGVMQAVPSRWPANYGGVDADNPDLRMRTGGCSLTQQAAGLCVQDFVQSFNPLVQRSPFATVLRRQVGFSGSGGPRWGAFRIAGGFDGDNGPYAVPDVSGQLNDFQRWNLRGHASVHPLAALEIGVTIGRVSSDLRLPTYAPVQAALRGPSDSAGFTWDSLFGRPGTQAVDRTSGIVEVRATPRPWLAIRGVLGLDDVDQRDGLLQPGQYRFDGRRQIRHQTSTLSASLNGPVRPGLRFRTTVGVERLGRRVEQAEQEGRDTVPLCALPCSMQWLAIQLHSFGTYIMEQVVVRERLFVSAALRHDRFDEYRLGVTNPSLVLSWLARGRLQLRAAYGSASAPPPDGLGSFYVGFPPPTPPPWRPERTRSFEVGADAGLLAGRWNARLTLYDMRSDVLRVVAVSSSTGYVYQYGSGAEISNRGVEATLGGPVLDRASLGWDLRLSVWGNRNRLVTLNGPSFLVGTQLFLPGYPTGGYWVTPIRSYADANADGIIAPSEVAVDSIWAWAGTPYPTQGAALTSTWRVAGRWRVAGTFDYRAGHHLFNEMRWSRCVGFPVCQQRIDPRTPLADQAVAVGATLGLPAAYVEDADYLKLREVWISFDVPPGAASALGARAATLTLAGRNLFTWTGYSGADPETGSYGLVTAGEPRLIEDRGTVPLPRSWTLRLRLTY